MNKTPAESLRIAIRLTPKASKNAVNGWMNDENGRKILKCSVTTVPENGKANTALIKLLSKYCGIPKSSISIIKGHNDRNKIVQFQNVK